ncbi:MAG: complex I subunit 5 family protein [Burkholderiaceae bacterium]|jgi:hydrogenase-4 component B|nr:complex I subunit 5 family protein [Burkholderiaceae bacterium]
MTVDAVLLLPLAVLWPLLLAGLSLLPGWGPRMLSALPLGPLPALAAAVTAPRDLPVALPWVLLDGGLELTGIGALFLGGAALLWFWAGVYAARYMHGDRNPVVFTLFWNLVLAGNLGVFIAADIVSFYVSFALVSLMAYPLVIHDRRPASLRAGTVYIALAVVGEAAILVGFMLASHGAGGAIGIAEAREVLAASAAHPAALWLLIVGFGIKAGLMPLHVWLPVAHPAAPTPASAVLSGAIVKAGIFGLVAFLPLGSPATVTGMGLALMGFAGLFAAALLGMAQSNAKSVLAYSTVSQMGLVMGVLGVALADGVPAAAVLPAVALFALHHGLAKGALFLGAGLARDCGGAWRWGLVAVLAVLALSVAGLPLTAGALVKSAIKEPAGALGAMLIGLSSLTSGLILARFIFVLPDCEHGPRPALLMVLPVLALAGAALWLPCVLYTGIVATAPLAVEDALSLIGSAWPLGLALLLSVVAFGVGLQPPPVPEGDLLGPVLRMAMAGRAVFRAGVAAGSRVLSESARPRRNVWGDNFERLERIIMDRAVTAIFLLAICGAIIVAFLA